MPPVHERENPTSYALVNCGRRNGFPTFRISGSSYFGKMRSSGSPGRSTRRLYAAMSRLALVRFNVSFAFGNTLEIVVLVAPRVIDVLGGNRVRDLRLLEPEAAFERVARRNADEVGVAGEDVLVPVREVAEARVDHALDAAPTV